MKKYILIALGSFLLSAPFAAPVFAGDEDELFGLGIGGVAGGVIGNQFGHGTGRAVATVAGALGGAYLGDRIGYAMDQPSSPRTSGAPYADIPLFDQDAYQVPYTPNYVAPSAPEPSAIYMDSSYGGYCRTFSQPVQVGNHVEEDYGTACMQPDGTWRVVQ
jgi:surface antigen